MLSKNRIKTVMISILLLIIMFTVVGCNGDTQPAVEETGIEVEQETEENDADEKIAASSEIEDVDEEEATAEPEIGAEPVEEPQPSSSQAPQASQSQAQASQTSQPQVSQAPESSQASSQAPQTPASQSQSSVSQSPQSQPAGTSGSGTFAGIAVNVLDKTTPAVSIQGRTNDRTVMCFVSASGQEVGVISHSDCNAIIQRNGKIISLPGGGTQGVPPVEGKSWEEWLADEFNLYRGLSTDSRKEAVTANIAETIAAYRQEVIRLVNVEREKVGLSALYADEQAMEYAQTRAQELLTSYSHTRPNGLEKPFDEIGAMNENIARGQYSPAEVVEDWMNSPGHRGNILNKDVFAIGVGCYYTGTSYYWTQEFLW